MRNLFLFAVAASAMAMAGSASAADTVTYNSTPSDGWYYGSGNDYVPANTAVLLTDAGDELYLRVHEFQQVAPASVGNVYTLGLGQVMSFDVGVNPFSDSLAGVTSLLTITNAAGGSASYDFLLTPDNAILNGGEQNSARLSFGFLNGAPGFNVGDVNYDANVDSTYTINLQLFGLAGGTKSLEVVGVQGAGFAAPIPEPATWALMLVGFGAVGYSLRRRPALNGRSRLQRA